MGYFFFIYVTGFQVCQMDLNFQQLLHYDFLTFLIILIPINFFIEWQKWNVICRNQTVDARQNSTHFYQEWFRPLSHRHMQEILLEGCFIFQNQVVSIVVNTLASNGSQFIISVVMGIIAFQFIYSSSISLLYHILLFLANASLIIYILLERISYKNSLFSF